MSFNSSGFWAIQKRCFYMHASIFKVKKIAPDTILYHIPNKNMIMKTNTEFNEHFGSYTFEDSPQCIEYVPKDGANYIMAGCINGIIEGQQENDPSQSFKLGGQGILEEGENYINDLKYLGHSRLANCYNNGTISIWDLEKEERVVKMRNVHERYTYKLRSFQERLFSCGGDGYAVVTDLDTCQQISSLKHPEPVWCIHPLSYNELATVGLFGQLKLWDLRTNRTVLYCPLQGNQSSFVTKLNQTELVLGDAMNLVKCDLRKFMRQPLSKDRMQVSAEGIQVLEDGAIVCGRGFEICRFKNSEQLKESTNLLNLWAPFFNNGAQLPHEQIAVDVGFDEEWEDEDDQPESDDEQYNDEDVIVVEEADQGQIDIGIEEADQVQIVIGIEDQSEQIDLSNSQQEQGSSFDEEPAVPDSHLEEENFSDSDLNS